MHDEMERIPLQSDNDGKLSESFFWNSMIVYVVRYTCSFTSYLCILDFIPIKPESTANISDHCDTGRITNHVAPFALLNTSSTSMGTPKKRLKRSNDKLDLKEDSGYTTSAAINHNPVIELSLMEPFFKNDDDDVDDEYLSKCFSNMAKETEIHSASVSNMRLLDSALERSHICPGVIQYDENQTSHDINKKHKLQPDQQIFCINTLFEVNVKSEVINSKENISTNTKVKHTIPSCVNYSKMTNDDNVCVPHELLTNEKSSVKNNVDTVFDINISQDDKQKQDTFQNNSVESGTIQNNTSRRTTRGSKMKVLYNVDLIFGEHEDDSCEDYIAEDYNIKDDLSESESDNVEHDEGTESVSDKETGENQIEFEHIKERIKYEKITQQNVLTEQPATCKHTLTEQPATSKHTLTEQPATSKHTLTEQTSKQTLTEQPSTNKQTLTEQPSTSKHILTEQPSTNKQTSTEQPSTSKHILTEQPATSKQILTEQTATSKQTLIEQPSTSKQTLAEQPATSKQILTEQPATSKHTLTEQPATTKQTLTEQPSTSKQTLTEQPATTKQTFTEQPSTSKQTLTEQPATTKQTFTEQPSTSKLNGHEVTTVVIEDEQLDACPLCPLLSIEFDNVALFSKHLEDHFGKARRKGTDKERQLYNRIRNCKELNKRYAVWLHRPVTCTKCGKTCSSTFRLRKHEYASHAPYIHKCEKCDKVYRTKLQLTRHHLSNHSGDEKKFSCDQCDNKFFTLPNLKLHLLRHKDTFYCEQCGKCFTSKTNLLQHTQSLSHLSVIENGKVVEVRNFMCEACGVKFGSKQHLRQHFKSNSHRTMIGKPVDQRFVKRYRKKNKISQEEASKHKLSIKECRKKASSKENKKLK